MNRSGGDSLPAPERFGSFDGRIWLNTAHQGPLPLAAAAAVRVAAEMKAAPHRIDNELFTDVPERVRSLLASLVGGAAEEIVVGDSTSHGLHLIANGLPWEQGDEVVVVEGDYPATVLPWQRLSTQGVKVRSLARRGPTITTDELAAAISPRTRVVALTLVDSFTGHAIDLHQIGAVCQDEGVLFVVNASQAIGARDLDVSSTPVDAVVSCGYKWLCGPYGTGFTWLHPELMAQLRPQQAYWLAMQGGRSLDQMRETKLRDDLGVRGFDMFCPARFLDMLPWTEALELILAMGVHAIADYDQRLVELLLEWVDEELYRVVSPRAGPSRSTLVVLERLDGTAKQCDERLVAAGIDTAFREGNLRLCPHLFNTRDEILRTAEVLNSRTPT
jgi:selenocysteine lyase/cysteine desulfurase